MIITPKKPRQLWPLEDLKGPGDNEMRKRSLHGQYKHDKWHLMTCRACNDKVRIPRKLWMWCEQYNRGVYTCFTCRQKEIKETTQCARNMDARRAQIKNNAKKMEDKARARGYK
jgi:hypothetical protein